MTMTITSLRDPRMQIRSAYGTRSGALRDHILHKDPRTYRALVDACLSVDEADSLIALARDAVARAGEGESAEALDRALGL